jgi:hypothetical protein
MKTEIFPGAIRQSTIGLFSLMFQPIDSTDSINRPKGSATVRKNQLRTTHIVESITANSNICVRNKQAFILS